MMGAPVRVNGSYSSSISACARESSAPMTTRSGFMKSSIAAPCFRNSGLLTTLKGMSRFAPDHLAHLLRRANRHRALVDDDLVAIHRTADVTGDFEHVLRSAEPSSPCGVPTAMNTTAESRTAFASVVVNTSRPSARFR